MDKRAAITESHVRQKSAFREVRDIMEAPWSDSEIQELFMQEPLPPNQPFQLEASEQPTENQPTYIETN